MDNLSIAAASGMRSRIEALDVLANNIANGATAGYKTDREFYNIYTAAEAYETFQDADVRSPAALPVIERNWTDFGQGALVATGNALDVAIQGKGFLVAQGPSGPLLTRAGNLHMGKEGRLETRDGYAILGQDGKEIRMDAERPVEIGAEGVVRQGSEEIGRLNLAMAPEDQLEKLGGVYFRLADVGKLQRAADAAVLQGRLEGSNSQPAEAAVRLVSVMRQFEMLQRAMSLGAEMNRRAVEEVAKPGQ